MKFLRLLILLGAVLFVTACPVQHYTIVTWHPGEVYTPTVEYRVYRSQLPASGFVAIMVEPQAVTTFTDVSVVSGQTYYYRITAYDTKTGRESLPSPTVGATIP